MAPIVSQLHFALSKLHCHKLQEKIIMKLIIIYYTVTRQKPSVRMDTFHIIFSYHKEDIAILSKEPPMPNSPHCLLLFPSQQHMQNNCP